MRAIPAPSLSNVLALPSMPPHLSDRDVRSLRPVSRSVRTAIAPEVAHREAARAIANTLVGSGQELRRLLGVGRDAHQAGPTTVQSLPEHLRAGPMVDLGSRLLQLPEADRPQAIRDFLEVPMPEGSHPILADMRRAAQGGEAGLAAREHNLVSHAGQAHIEVQEGQNIPEVARRHGIGGERAIQSLNRSAVAPAEARLGRETSFAAVVREIGITDAESLRRMNEHATRSLDFLDREAAIGNPDAFFNTPRQRQRPPDPMLESAVRYAAAERAVVNQPGNVWEAARRFGISEHDAASTLERRVADANVNRLRYARPEQVAALVTGQGIRQPALVTRLERAAIDQHGLALLQSGQTPEAVAQQLGVRMPEHLERLRQMGADQAANQP